MAVQRRAYRKIRRADDQQETRRRILTAARDAFFERNYDEVTLAAVARAAGTSAQTLLNNFGSKEKLLVAVAEFVRPEVDALRGSKNYGTVDEAVGGLMRQYEALGDANVRLGLAADRFPELRAAVEFGRDEHRRWLEVAFADSLAAEQPLRLVQLGALYAATDVGTWKLLRRDLGYSPADTAAVFSLLIESALKADS